MANFLIADSTVRAVLKYGLIAILCLIGLLALVCIVMPKKTLRAIVEKIKIYFNAHKTFGEILRFVIVGGIATVVDMFVMGVVMYFMQKQIYPTFLNVFVNTPKPSTAATIVGTASGFCVGLIVNYVLSILFVFNEKGKSKTVKGFVVFVVLSVIGLFLNMLGMYLGYDVMKINQWVVKIVVTIIVLVYNYISKRLLLFKKGKQNLQPTEQNEASNENLGKDHSVEELKKEEQGKQQSN